MQRSLKNWLPRRVDPADQEDLIIVVIGPPGVGKSTFINVAIDRQELPVSYGLDSSTRGVQFVRCPHPKDRHIIFVDTPPLYEDNRALLDIEKEVEHWMAGHTGRRQVAGILYLQRITDRKMTHLPFDYRRGYCGLHGEDFCRKFCFVTTMWSHVREEMGAHREEELRREWGWMMDSGSRMMRFDHTPESAWSIVKELLKGVSPGIGSDSSGSDMAELPREGANQDADNLSYADSRPAPGRHLDKAVVLIVGMTGHGKSKTINRLVAHNLLEVGNTTSGPTTKVVQRATIPIHDTQTPVKFLAFDDTRADEDTTSDPLRSAVLMYRYGQAHFPEAQQSLAQHTDGGSGFSVVHDHQKKYPNAILLVASWDSIKADAHNHPRNFTSAIGKTIFNLKLSRLVDLERTNVIVVITKSLSSWQDYDDYENDDAKRRHWNNDARKKTGIVGALQRKVFPPSRPWPVVFIENGGGRAILQRHRMLPNGELSHQNLFEAIRDLFSVADTKHKSRDLVGLQALRLLTGMETLRSHFDQLHVETLCELKPSDTITEEEQVSIGLKSTRVPPLHVAPPAKPRDIVNHVLGFTYNPIHGKFGRSSVLALDQSSIPIKPSRRQFELIPDAKGVSERLAHTASQLRADFKMRNIPSLSSHYPSSSSLKSAVSAESQVYVARKIIAVAVVAPPGPLLSAEILDQIERLPTWSTETDSDYHNFFTSYGTHIVLRAALGGVLRIVAKGDLMIDERIVMKTLEAGADISGPAPPIVETGAGDRRKLSGEGHITVFQDGGRAVANQLSGTLENLFFHLQNPSLPSQISDWADARMRWIDALETDVVFCPDDRETSFEWLHNCKGLTDARANDLRLASRSYLQAPLEDSAETQISDLPTSEQLRDTANNILGFTYNPIYGNLGSLSVLSLDQSDIQIVKATSHHFEQIIKAKDLTNYDNFAAAQYRADFKMRELAGLSAHYSSSTAFESAMSWDSHLYIARKLTGIARVVPLRPRLSSAMLNQINKLPRWSTETESHYYNFFECHGTHVVLCAALGGVLRIISRGEMEIDEWTVRQALEAESDAQIPHTDFEHVVSPSGGQITVFCDGGGTVARELSGALESMFYHIQNSRSGHPPPDWPRVRLHWMNALETDSIFCPDDPQSQYWWLYNCDGLTDAQQNDLKLASKAYLQASVEEFPVHAVPVHPDLSSFLAPSALPREKNLEEVDRILEQVHWMPSYRTDS